MENGHGVPIFRDDVVVTKFDHIELPKPPNVDLSGWDWDKGFSDARNTGWIELEGRIEQIFLIDDSTRLWCEGKTRKFAVRVAEPINVDEAWELYGAQIRVHGSLGILLDRQNRIHAPLLLTQKRSFIKTIQPSNNLPAPDSYARISHWNHGANQSFQTSGQVTLADSGKLFLDDGFAARAIHLSSTFETPVDSFVEVLGSSDSFGNWHAHVVKFRNETLNIWPMQLAIKDLTADEIGRRIQIRAFAKDYESQDGRLCVSDDGARAFVILPSPAGKEVKEIRRDLSGEGSLDLATANELDVFGVLEDFENGVPVIHAVRRDDVRVLSRRWTLTSTTFLWVLGALSTLLIGIFLIVIWLRSLVASRTQSLSDLAAQLQASCESVDAGVVAVGEDGTLLTVNEKANSLLGLSLSPGDPAKNFVDCWTAKTEDSSEVYRMASAFSSDRDEPSSCEVALTEGGRLRVTLTAINRDGRRIGNLWVMHDETQLQRLQAELFQAQKMEAVGTLAGGIAHDFNNLLTAILGNLQLIGMTDSDATEKRESFVEQAEAACMSAGELVQQLLGMSRKTDMKQQVVDPNELVNNIQSLLRHGFDSNISFEFRTSMGLPSVNVDPTQIEQVLLNLCVNARDAMPSGGKIVIGTEAGTLNNEPAVAIRVSDTGEGIPANIRDKIFEPFFTTKGVGKGTGLGLATSFSVVSRHQGELLCDSKIGIGTTFRIVLPVAKENAVANENPLPQIESLKGVETILVVDDEWVVRTVASNLLKSGGYRTVEAVDGASSLELLNELHSDIDLVLLDVTMPGMSGHETLREIRNRFPSLPVLMCSGYDLKGEGDISFDHFVSKPFSASSLFAAIRRTLDDQLTTADDNRGIT